MCPLITPMFMTIRILQWWTLIKPKVVKEARQRRPELRTQVQSYVNQTELTSKLNLQYSSPLLHGSFIQRTTDLEKTANMNWFYSLSLTTSADTFLYKGNVWAHDKLSPSWRNTWKKQTSQESNPWIRPNYQNISFIIILEALTWNANCFSMN